MNTQTKVGKGGLSSNGPSPRMVLSLNHKTPRIMSINGFLDTKDKTGQEAIQSLPTQEATMHESSIPALVLDTFSTPW